MPILRIVLHQPVNRAPFALALLLAALIGSSADAQQMLAFKKSRYKIAYYHPGDLISYRLHGDRERYTAQIEGFTDTTIVFRHAQVGLRAISHVYVDEKTREWFAMRYKYEKLLLIAGFGYF